MRPVAILAEVEQLLQRNITSFWKVESAVAVQEKGRHLHDGASTNEPHADKRPDLLTEPRWLRGLKTLAKYSFKCSLEVFASQLPDLLTAVRLNPDIHFSIVGKGWPLAIDPSGFLHSRRSLEALTMFQRTCHDLRQPRRITCHNVTMFTEK